MYVPKKQANYSYEGIWSGPHEIDPMLIRRSHHTSRSALPTPGYENKPIRIQHWPTTGYLYRIVDGNKRLALAKRLQLPTITAYIFVRRTP